MEIREEALSVEDLGESSCGRKSPQQESLQVLRIVESSSTADNGSHHVSHCWLCFCYPPPPPPHSPRHGNPGAE